MTKLNTTDQEAARLNLAPKTLANWRWRGDGPPYVLMGRLPRYDPELTDAWLAGQVRHSTTGA